MTNDANYAFSYSPFLCREAPVGFGLGYSEIRDFFRQTESAYGYFRDEVRAGSRRVLATGKLSDMNMAAVGELSYRMKALADLWRDLAGRTHGNKETARLVWAAAKYYLAVQNSMNEFIFHIAGGEFAAAYEACSAAEPGIEALARECREMLEGLGE